MTTSWKIVAHLAGSAAVAAVLVGFMVYPFLPGPYDGMALGLSAAAQAAGGTGLLLVPLGLLWFAMPRAAYIPALCAWMVGLIAVLVASLAASATLGRALGAGLLLLWICASLLWLEPAIRRLKGLRAPGFHPAPLYFIVVPVAFMLCQILLAAPARDRSRRRAISNSAELIAKIEAYRAAHGKYPASLDAVWQDYKPGVVGIPRYYYSPSGDAYNLHFEQPRFLLDDAGAREFVVYNPRGEQTMISHDSWILLLPPEELARQPGWFAVRDAGAPNWKFFLFD